MSAQLRFVRFGPFIVDRAQRQLFRDGRRVRITPLPTAILLVLLDRPGEYVSKDALFALVWNNVVTDSALYKAMALLRRILASGR